MIEYSDEYNEYWQRPDRVGTSSFDSPKPIARQIIKICGPGKLLDIGCGMGALVRELLGQGVDAHGVDVSSVVVQEANRLAPGRFVSGSILELPFDDQSFETIVSTDCMEHLAPEDIPAAFAEIRRVGRRHVFLRIATGPDRDNHWHLTIENRPWWEQMAFAAGFRKHPGYFRVNSFEALENDPYSITIPLERMPDSALPAHSQDSSRQDVCSDTDMLRQTGRRSDALIYRYGFAARYVLPHEPVVDLACGTGYGCAVLFDSTLSSRVIGVDARVSAIAYARDIYGRGRYGMEFVEADAARLPFFKTASVGTLIAFDVIEHQAAPDALLAEAKRVLVPGGRFVCSIHNQRHDESTPCVGEPGLFSLGLRDIKTICAEHFLIEQIFSQNAGGESKNPDIGRRMVEIDPDAEGSAFPAEWWIVVAIKNCLPPAPSFARDTFQQTLTAATEDDLGSPFDCRALNDPGFQIRRPQLLARLCRNIHDVSPPFSPNAGMALSVLTRQALDADTIGSDQREWLIHALRGYLQGIESRHGAGSKLSPNTDHSVRWAISITYLLGKLHQQTGQLDEARLLFWKCANMTIGMSAPEVAPELVDAAFRAGWLSMGQGKSEEASTAWRLGLESADKAISRNWREILADADRAAALEMQGASRLLDAARKCAKGLQLLQAAEVRPGYCAAQICDSIEARYARLNEDDASKISELQARLNHLQDELARISNDYSKTLNSYSWKLTAPLRVIAAFAKSLVR